MSKIQDQNPRKPNAICNYPLRSCSTTGGGRQPSEHYIEDSMDIGENENAVIMLPLLCSLWHFGGGQFMFPVAVIGMISLFTSVSGGYMHKSICNSMLLGLNAFYEWGQCFLSEPWYDDPVRICFGSPMCVNGSVIPDCWALRPFIDQYCGKHFVAYENFFDEIVLRYFGWTLCRNLAKAECCWGIWKISTSWLAYNSNLRLVNIHSINPGGYGGKQCELVSRILVRGLWAIRV